MMLFTIIHTCDSLFKYLNMYKQMKSCTWLNVHTQNYIFSKKIHINMNLNTWSHVPEYVIVMILAMIAYIWKRFDIWNDEEPYMPASLYFYL